MILCAYTAIPYIHRYLIRNYSGAQPQVYKRVRGTRGYLARNLRAHACCARVQFARHESKKGVNHAACTITLCARVTLQVRVSTCASQVASATEITHTT